MGKPGTFKMGRCIVIVTIDKGEWHLSISARGVMPSYKEMKAARYHYCPDDIYMAEIFPPSKEFVNLHEHCRHLWQIKIKDSNYGREKNE